MLDFTSVVMGPVATQILGDLGADVITVEPARGDINRAMGRGPVRQLSDISLNLLRNKRNVSIDVKRPEGRDALLRVAAGCEVFVTNLRPGPLRRLGLDYAAIAAVRPDVVYCRAHGFPSDGPLADEPAFDDVVQAAGGVADVVGRASGTPAFVPTLLADKVSGLVLAYAALAALYHRAVTGRGQEVEVPMADALSSFMLVEHGSGGVSGAREGGVGYQRILTSSRRPQRSSDGWVCLFPYLDAHWRALLLAGGQAALADDPRLSREGRFNDPDFSYAALDAAVATRTTAEWLDFSREHGIPASEVADLETLTARLPDAHHPHAGPYKHIPSPVRFSLTPASLRRPAPMIGEHNREVLREAGLDDPSIDALEVDGVLRAPRRPVDPTRQPSG